MKWDLFEQMKWKVTPSRIWKCFRTLNGLSKTVKTKCVLMKGSSWKGYVNSIIRVIVVMEPWNTICEMQMVNSRSWLRKIQMVQCLNWGSFKTFPLGESFGSVYPSSVKHYLIVSLVSLCTYFTLPRGSLLYLSYKIVRKERKYPCTFIPHHCTFCFLLNISAWKRTSYCEKIKMQSWTLTMSGGN